MEGTLRPGGSLTSVMASSIGMCEEHLGSYLGDAPSAPDAAFRNTISFALALMRVSADHAEPTAIDLRLIRDAARDAGEACRKHGFDEELLLAAGAFDRVADACAAALRPRPLPS